MGGWWGEAACSLLVVGAGLALAIQQVVNARLRGELGSPWWAGTASYVGGMLAMLLMAGATRSPLPPADAFARTSWPSWTGGLCGAVYIAVAIFMVPRLGAATVVALIVVGQMLGSLACDHFGLLGIAHHPATPLRLLGAGCLILGVILIRS